MNYTNNHQLQFTFISCTVPFVEARIFAQSQTEKQHFCLVPINLDFFVRLTENRSKM